MNLKEYSGQLYEKNIQVNYMKRTVLRQQMGERVPTT